MKIVVAGGTGFLGRPLCETLATDGHAVVVLTRSVSRASSSWSGLSRTAAISAVDWSPDGRVGAWASVVDGADAVINLTGESIGARRWSKAQKARIRDSRMLATRSVVAAIKAAPRPPAVLINASAIGYYGDRGAEQLTEPSKPGSGFLADLCVEWEGEATSAATASTRVTLIRNGLVLERGRGGVLDRMLLPFKFFAGGPVGSGRQYMSWIHRTDWIDLVRWALATSSVPSGPLNGTAPAPATNAEFSKALGHALGRPSWLPAPAFALRLALGEMADELLLGGQRVLPSRPLELGFQFKFPKIDHALGEIFQD